MRAGWRIALFTLIWSLALGLLFLPLRAFDIDLVNPRPLDELLIVCMTAVATLAAVGLAARSFDRRRFRDYGLALDGRFVRDLVAGSITGALLVVVVFVVLRLADFVRVANMRLDAAAVTTAATYLVTHVFVGVNEELISRGYWMLNLEEGFRTPRLGFRGAAACAAVASALFFALMHGGNEGVTLFALFNLLIIALAVPVLLTRSLAFAIGVHAAWNFVLSSVAGFPVSGKVIPHTIFQMHITGPDLLTGGPFGPEGGLLDLVASMIRVIASMAYARLFYGAARILPPPELKPQGTPNPN